MTIRVLVVDDSALARDLVVAALARAPEIQVIGSAADPIIARHHLCSLRPDVMTLDVEMPNMDGLAFLEQLMRLHPLPVVMVSSLTASGSAPAFQALRAGAVGVVQKPMAVGAAFEQIAQDIVRKVRLAATTHCYRPPRKPVMARLPSRLAARVVVVGGGVGSLPAVEHFLDCWPHGAPPLALALNIEGLSLSLLAAALSERLKRSVQLARADAVLTAGSITLLTSGDVLSGTAEAPVVHRLSDGSSTAACCQVNDALHSAAFAYGPQLIGVLLSGEPAGGEHGIAAVAAGGGVPLIRDRVTSMLFPVGCEESLPDARRVPLPRLAEAVLSCCSA